MRDTHGTNSVRSCSDGQDDTECQRGLKVHRVSKLSISTVEPLKMLCTILFFFQNSIQKYDTTKLRNNKVFNRTN